MRKSYGYLFLMLIAFFAASCSGGGGGGFIIPTGSATLSWTAPTLNNDGTSLTDLEGFKVHYGTASGSYTHTIDVGNATTYTVTGLPAGATYYFVVTAYNTPGVESVPSNEAHKKI